MKRLIGEFETQSYTQIIFPHKNTDWFEYLDDAEKTFVNIINTIRVYQKCLVVCYSVAAVKKHFSDEDNLIFVEYETDDTWARDCSALSIEENGKVKHLDFIFNAWGNKFDSKKDNLMSKTVTPDALSCSFVLEGGAVESNGNGTILTTSQCILNPNRNPNLNKEQINEFLHDNLGAKEVLYLNHGYLAGDDTDSHIDTLARFINEDTIMYVKCEDKNDEHYEELFLMEQELQEIAKQKNYKLVTLPMSDLVYFEGERLPSTYANFLFVNGAVIVPIYGVKSDVLAIKIFKETFTNKEIISIDCSLLIRQHGSLHCVTMNFNI